MTNTEITAALNKARQLCTSAGFEPEGDNTFTSRGDGNGTDCEPDPATLSASRTLIKEIRALGLQASRDVCDEWVSIMISAPAK